LMLREGLSMSSSLESILPTTISAIATRNEIGQGDFSATLACERWSLSNEQQVAG
jgi:hypothetical protein